MTDASSDRLIDPVDLPGETMPGGGDGSGGGLDRDRVDRTVRAPDNNEPLLDAEGLPFQELDAERSDDLAQRSATVRQLAVDEQVWRFGHVIVDEAQDLTPMQWRMVVRRSTRGSVTMLGDLAQRSVGEPGTWDDHLPPEFSLFEQQNLTTNYRSPAEINDLAAAVLAKLAPGLPASRAVRRSGHEPKIVEVASIADELPGLLTDRVARNGQSGSNSPAGAASGGESNGEQNGGGGRTRPPVVIGFDLPHGLPVRTLSPWRAKGLEFDSVVVVEPARFLDEPNGLSLLYVALTRSTDLLTIVHQRPLPAVLVR